MLPSPLPQWLRDQLTEMIDSHLILIPLLEERCTQTAEACHRNEDGDLCDDAGTLDDYRLDGKYSAGQAIRLLQVLRERLTDAEWAQSPYAQLPMDPRRLADWAWANPWKPLKLKLATTPMDEAPLQWRDFYLLYPERERQALVYELGCGMSLQEIADKMGITIQAVRSLLSRARARGQNARDVRVGVNPTDARDARIGKRL